MPSSAHPATAAAPLADAAFRLRLRVMAGDTIAVGPGKIALLEALGHTGSISAAARQLNMSYRRAWLLIDDINAALREPAVQSSTGGQHGGGSALTPTGRELIALYREIEAEALRATQTSRRRLQALLAPAAETGAER